RARVLDRHAARPHVPARPLGALRRRSRRGAPDADRATNDRGLARARQQPAGDGRSPGVSMRATRWRAAAIAALVALAACHRTTATLNDANARRFEAEGVVRRAPDLVFRKTHDVGTRAAGWEELVASIVVTKASVVIHRRDRFALEITPRSTGAYEVARDHD